MYRIKKLFPQFLKNLYHLAMAVLANIVFGFPSRKLKVIGVTGTDGKTTTVQIITKILEEAGKKVAMASTINFSINGRETKNLSHYTTESSFAVQKFARKAVSEGCEYLVLETSSHSLDQYRVWGVKFRVALITNITREHLDYHKTMEKYREAKEKLFKIVVKNKGTVIVNADMDEAGVFLAYAGKNSAAYSVCKNKIDSDCKLIKAEKIELGLNGSAYEVQGIRYEVHLPGMFNIENALGATCVALGEGIDPKTIKVALKKIKGVPGRLEHVDNNRKINILVDFALTPEALRRLYEMISTTKKKHAKVIAVFGACGERDKGKRPIIGKIVSQFADFMILTNDEPYHESPKCIIEEIFAGIENKKEEMNVWKIEDRRLAIRKALEIAKEDDVVVVTGMGNFETMVVGDEKIPWNDRKVIEEELQKL